MSRKMKGINSLKNCWALAESRAVNVGIISPVPWLSAGDGASGMCCGSPKESFPLFLMGVGVVGVFSMWLCTELWVFKSLQHPQSHFFPTSLPTAGPKLGLC